MMWTDLLATRNALYPTRCAGCGEVGRGAPCARCDATLQLRASVLNIGGLEACWALAPYAGGVGERVARAKRLGDRSALRMLGSWLAEHAHDVVAGAWFVGIVPAPSPWTRRVRRGFSPAHVVAAEVARATGLRLRRPLRVRPGVRQSSLPSGERPSDLRQRLRCRPVPRGHLLLVDDVLTTGATLSSCAATLREAGATGVWGLVLCDARRMPMKAPRASGPRRLPSGRAWAADRSADG